MDESEALAHDTASSTWQIVPDDESPGLFHTRCPRCGSLDTIVEQDSAIRWNSLMSLTPTGAVAHLGSSGDYDFEQWFCTGRNCGADDLDAPEGFEISDWY